MGSCKVVGQVIFNDIRMVICGWCGPTLLDVVYMKGEEQLEFQGYRKDYAYLNLFFFRTLLDSMLDLPTLSYVTLLM